jgi:acyl-coenzyme A synthetase/AMP-(fatty) acid ligase
LRKVDGAEILRRVDQHGVTVMCGAPVWNAVLDAAATWDGDVPGRGRVRIVCAGAPPPTRMIQRVDEALGWEFIQIYGLTAPIVTFNRTRPAGTALPARQRARQLGRAGAPALGVQVKILDRIMRVGSRRAAERPHGPAVRAGLRDLHNALVGATRRRFVWTRPPDV